MTAGKTRLPSAGPMGQGHSNFVLPAGDDAVLDIHPTGFHLECPHCHRELRVASKYSGEQVEGKFCDGVFRHDTSNRLINTVAFYGDCPHCLHEIRMATKYSGMTVACKLCDGKVRIQQREPAPAAFRVEQVGATMIVIPQGDSMSFRYDELHLEVNAIQRKSLAPDIKSVLIDLGQVRVLSGIMADALVKLARNASNNGRGAAFCRASHEIRNVVSAKKIDSIWRLYDSRSTALAVLL